MSPLPPHRRSPRLQPSPCPEPGAKRVLVVEDERLVLDYLADAIRGLGHWPVLAASAAEAVWKLEQEEVDAALLDVVLPRVGGPELAAVLRAARPDLPLIYMSGYPPASVETRIGSELPGAYLQKPFGAAELRRALDRALGEPVPEDAASASA